MANQSGGCHCGAVKYEISADPILTAHCQCTDCQKLSCTGHSSNYIVPGDAVTVTGDMTRYTVTGDSGGEVTRSFCPKCATAVFSESTSLPGAMIMKAGTLDNPSVFKPQMVIYTDSAQDWDTMAEDLQRFPGMPPLG